MVKFELNEIQHQTPDGWKDVTFGKFLDYLSDITTEEPKALKEFIEGHVELLESFEESIPVAEKEQQATESFLNRWKDMPLQNKLKCYDYFALSVGFWCDLEPSTIKEAMNKDQLFQAFWTIQANLDLNQLKADEDFVSFKLRNKEWFLPKKHMEGSTVVEFAEAAQFQERMQDLQNGEWLSMLDVMVVLCRPLDEVYEYKEAQHEMRKKWFKELDMTIVANVSFFLLKLNKILNNNLLIYSLHQLVHLNEIKKLEKDMAGL